MKRMSGPPELWRTSLRDVTLKARPWNPFSEPRETIRYVDVSAVSRETLEISNVEEIPGATAPSRARKIIESGDTIFATIRPSLKRVAQVSDSLHGEVASTAFCVLRPNRNVIDPEFLFFVASNEVFVDEVAFFETGASYPAVRDSDVLDREILLPPLPDQRQIARVLGTARMALLHQSKCLAAAEDLKRAAMRELFTHGLRGEAQKETEFGMTPEGWPVRPIGEFTSQMQYGLSIRGEPEGRYPILRMNCQEDGNVLMRDLQFVDLDRATAEAYQLRAGDILFNRTNSYELVGRTAILEHDAEAVFASYLVRVAVDRERLNPRCLNYFLNWDVAQAELKKLASRGVSQANISASKLRGFAIPIPPTLDEQREIVEILDAIDRKIDLHKRKRAVLEELFKTLLHKLMTGEIHVADLDLSALKPAAKAEAAE
jgi:type I restriction enzyme, S subunit